MQKRDVVNIVLIVLLVLVLLGYISLGDVLGIVFGILGALVLLAVVGVFFVRWRLRRMARRMQDGGGQGAYRTYTWSSGQQRRRTRQEGEVTVRQTRVREKRVSGTVGEYVEYEDVKEKD